MDRSTQVFNNKLLLWGKSVPNMFILCINKVCKENCLNSISNTNNIGTNHSNNWTVYLLCCPFYTIPYIKIPTKVPIISIMELSCIKCSQIKKYGVYNFLNNCNL